MKTFFYLLGKIFDILLFPFRGLPPLAGLTFIAFITGFLAVFVFKYVSNQKALKRIMGRIKLHFVEILLYRDDFQQIISAQKEILKQNLRYFLHTIKPAIPIMAAVLIILSQINIRYSIRPLLPGNPLTVKIIKENAQTSFSNSQSDIPASSATEDVQMILPEGLELLTPAFHLPESGQIEWRIQGKHSGSFYLKFQSGRQTYQKKIIIGPVLAPFSPHLGRQGFFEYFFNPLEELLPKDSPIESIDLDYQAMYFKTRPFGLQIHWLVAFLLIAIAFGLVCRKILKVS